MRRILLATLTSLTLGLPIVAAVPAWAQTAGATATSSTTTAHRRHRRSHHHAMSSHAGRAAGRGLSPDTTGSASTGTSASDPTGAQTSLSNAVHNQTPAATH